MKIKIMIPALIMFATLAANGIFNYGTSLELLNKTHSSVSFGLGLITGPIIGLVLAKPITVLLHKFDNHLLSTIGLVGATLSMLLYSFFISDNKAMIYTAVLFLSINGIFMRIFNYAYMNNQIHIVGEDHIQQLNALEQGSISVLQIVNPIITALLWAWISLPNTLWVAVGISLIGIVLLPRVKYQGVRSADDNAALPSFKMVVASVLKQPTVRKVFLLETLLGIFLVSEIVAIPYILVTGGFVTEKYLGLVQGIAGIGAVVGASVAFFKKTPNALKILRVTTVSIGALYLILAFMFGITSKSAALVAVVVVSMVISLISTFASPISYTAMQTSLSEETRADVITWYYTIQEMVYPIGAALVSILMVGISPTKLYLLYGFMIILIGLVVMRGKQNA